MVGASEVEARTNPAPVVVNRQDGPYQRWCRLRGFHDSLVETVFWVALLGVATLLGVASTIRGQLAFWAVSALFLGVALLALRAGHILQKQIRADRFSQVSADGGGLSVRRRDGREFSLSWKDPKLALGLTTGSTVVAGQLMRMFRVTSPERLYPIQLAEAGFRQLLDTARSANLTIRETHRGRLVRYWVRPAHS